MRRDLRAIDLCLCFFLTIFGLVLAGARAGFAQQTSPAQAGSQAQQTVEQSTYTFKVSANLVQLDVVVRNAKGDLVTGLRREDFTVLEDGQPQKILSFDFTTPTPRSAAGLAGIDSTAELDRRQPEAPVTIIVLDELATKFEDEYFERYFMQKYLSKQGEALDQPMMLIARTLDRTMVLCDYTTSKKKLLKALNNHLVGNDWRNQNPSFKDVQLAAEFASLFEVAEATQGHPGHKNLVWIGHGFPGLQWSNMGQDQSAPLQQLVAKCVEQMREARITLYVIDPGGVSPATEHMDENGVESLDDPFGGVVDFGKMATATGGLSMHGRNDIDHLIDNAVANGETFYSLAYRPSWTGDEDSGQFHKIKVVLNDSSLVAISRQGYFPNVAGDSGGKGATGAGSQFDLASACSGLMVFDGVPLTVTRKNPSAAEVQVSFPASAIGLALTGDKLTGDVTFLVLSYDRAGKLLTKKGSVVSLHLAPLPPGQSEDRKIQLAASLDPQAPAARVRLVVRANANGRIGADNFFLVDPATLRDRQSGLKAQKTASH